jgi:hypothetical protein
MSAKMGRLTAAKRNAAKTPAQSALASARRIRAPTWRHALAPTARLTLAVTPTMRKLKITTAEFVVAAKLKTADEWMDTETKKQKDTTGSDQAAMVGRTSLNGRRGPVHAG